MVSAAPISAAELRGKMPFNDWPGVAADTDDADRRRTVAVLPLAATEQHGPHLPVTTDCVIGDGLLAEASGRSPVALAVLRFPTETVGASLEHGRFPGTRSLSVPQLIERIVARGEEVAGAGLRKLVVVSSHGGNVAAMMAAALECRARFDLLAVTLTWNRLGYPVGMISEEERALGVHGGQVETSLMLHFAPKLVRMDRAADFPSLQSVLAGRYGLLRAYGPIGFGWLAGDLNPQGVTGNAAAATAAIGAAIAAHQSAAFVELLHEVADADTDALIR
jgi:creatinine amidohydrolase